MLLREQVVECRRGVSLPPKKCLKAPELGGLGQLSSYRWKRTQPLDGIDITLQPAGRLRNKSAQARLGHVKSLRSAVSVLAVNALDE
jgi:hypothetical protein